MFRNGFLISIIVVFFGQFTWAAGPILNAVERIQSASHFKVKYRFSNPVDAKKVSTELINNTVQINVAGAELEQDKRFDKLSDAMVKNLYSYMPDRDQLSLRINYKNKFDASQFQGRVSYEIDGKDLIVTIADGRAIALGTLDNILEKPSNLNAQQIEDKYKYLQQKLSDEEIEEQETVNIEMPKVININNFDKEIAGQLKFDNSDSIKDAVPSLQQKQEGPIKVKKIINGRNTASEKKEVLVEEELGVDAKKPEVDKASLKENEIPVFSSPDKKVKEIKNTSEPTGIWSAIAIFGAMVLVSVMGIRRYTSKKLKENKHTSIKVLTQHHLGPKKSLAIIRVAGESILIGVTDNNINLIKSLSLLDEDLPEEDNISQKPKDFQQSLSMETRVQNQRFAMDTADFEEEEEFSVRGLKDMVRNKLNGLKEL